MQNKQKINFINKLLDSYLKKNKDQEQASILNDWADDQQLRSIDAEDLLNENEVKDEVWEAIQQKLDAKKNKTSPVLWYRWGAAALALLALTLGLLINVNRTEVLSQSPVAQLEQTEGLDSLAIWITHYDGVVQQIREADESMELVSIRYEDGVISELSRAIKAIRVPQGRTVALNLSDGSSLVVNASSTVEIAADFNQKNRQITLDGEAYFDVAHNPDKPFVIQANNSKIEVLGTSFNVKSYSNSKQHITTLISGKVSWESGLEKITLVPNQQVKYQKEDQKISLKLVDVKSALAWRDNMFYFDDEPLADILQDASNWYDFKLAEGQIVPKMHLSGSYSRAHSLQQFLNHLELLTGLRFEKNKHTNQYNIKI